MARLAAGLACLALTACSGTGLLNAASGGGVEVRRDLAYGDLPRQRLDVWTADPRKAEARGRPVLLFIHGGSWRSGDKADYAFLGRAFAREGVETVVADYRLHPEAIFPAFVEDGAGAIVHVKRTIARDRPLFVMGHSAGAHVAALALLDPKRLGARGETACSTTAGWIGLAGPYDFTPVEPVFRAIFPEESRAEQMPLAFAATRSPPALLIHGLGDRTVAPARSQEMARALAAAGNRVTMRALRGVDHVVVVGAISPLLRARATTFDDVLGFIDAERAAGYRGCSPETPS